MPRFQRLISPQVGSSQGAIVTPSARFSSRRRRCPSAEIALPGSRRKIRGEAHIQRTVQRGIDIAVVERKPLFRANSRIRSLQTAEKGTSGVVIKDGLNLSAAADKDGL